jgi:hypothetical protein
VPSAIKHDLELSEKGLVTVLMERQGADAQKLEAFLLAHWPQNRALACTGAPVPTPDFQGIPHAALIGVDGTLLWDGSPSAGTKKLDELVEAELAKVKKGWGENEEARRARALLYGKGDLAGAHAVAAAMPEGAARSALVAEVERRYALAKKRVATLRAQGRWIEALAAARDLQKGAGARAEWSAELQPLVAEFDGDAGKAALADEKKLQKVLKQLGDGRDDSARKALRALVKQFGGNGAIAGRAERLLRALETSTD